MSESGFDPKLKSAMEDIKKIMDKYDIGGGVALVSKTHSEFLAYPPGWTAISISDNSNIRVKINAEKYPEKHMKKAAAENTVHFCFASRLCLGTLFDIIDTVCDGLAERWDITEDGLKFTPHNSTLTKLR